MYIFNCRVSRGNNKGISFLRIPQNDRNKFNEGDTLEASVNNCISFYGRVRRNRNGIGLYLPKNANPGDELYGENVTVTLKRIDGFYSRLGKDGRLYIPQDIHEKFFLESDDIIEVEFTVNGERGRKFCKVKTRRRGAKKECMCILDSKKPMSDCIFMVVRKASKGANPPANIEPALHGLSFIPDGEDWVVFDGKKKPLVLNGKMDLKEMAHYLGCFLADGTKKGNSWALSASTFSQAKYFSDLHKNIIRDSVLRSYISFTARNAEDAARAETLAELWSKETGIKAERVRVRETKSENPGKWNEFGTMVLMEHRKLTQTIYNRLVSVAIDLIYSSSDADVALDFICGVIEGDGSPSAKKRGHILIATNKEDVLILDKVLSKTDLEYKIFYEGPDRVFIRLNSLGLLKNIHLIGEKIFKYYPKRRKRFIERFQAMGAARFVMGLQPNTNNIVKNYLVKNDILDRNYALTEKGGRIKSCLVKMANEVKS